MQLSISESHKNLEFHTTEFNSEKLYESYENNGNGFDHACKVDVGFDSETLGISTIVNSMMVYEEGSTKNSKLFYVEQAGSDAAEINNSAPYETNYGEVKDSKELTFNSPFTLIALLDREDKVTFDTKVYLDIEIEPPTYIAEEVKDDGSDT